MYQPEQDDEHSSRRISLAGSLGRAIDNGDITVHYQPIINMKDGTVGALEALVRWDHQELGRLSAEEFVPIAEGAGLIRPLTNYVLAESARLHQSLKRGGFEPDLTINLSVRSVVDVAAPEQITELLGRHQLPAERVVFEITEDTLMAHSSRTIGALRGLCEQGFRISIDDFGTGYSSLAYLKRLPVSELKIDQSFIDGMLEDPNMEAIVRSRCRASTSVPRYDRATFSAG
jgi:EAL domain-containing protein (putative c-di-GMP-specific phosphodiesterase class I)